MQCFYDGICTNLINGTNYDFNCSCKFPYYGKNCQLKQNVCKGVTCSKKGVCYKNETRYYCKCFKGYSGQNCEIESSQVKTIKAVNNVSAYFSITFIVIFYGSVLLLDICHYWKSIKKYFKRTFMKKNKKIIKYDEENTNDTAKEIKNED